MHITIRQKKSLPTKKYEKKNKERNIKVDMNMNLRAELDTKVIKDSWQTRQKHIKKISWQIRVSTTTCRKKFSCTSKNKKEKNTIFSLHQNWQVHVPRPLSSVNCQVLIIDT